MLQYKKIDVSEGIYVNKTSASKECEPCHYWYFKDVEFNLKSMFVMVVINNNDLFVRKNSDIER